MYTHVMICHDPQGYESIAEIHQNRFFGVPPCQVAKPTTILVSLSPSKLKPSDSVQTCSTRKHTFKPDIRNSQVAPSGFHMWQIMFHHAWLKFQVHRQVTRASRFSDLFWGC